MFDFWDYNQPAAIYFMAYLAVMGAFISASYYSMKFIQKRFLKENKEKFNE